MEPSRRVLRGGDLPPERLRADRLASLVQNLDGQVHITIFGFGIDSEIGHHKCEQKGLPF